MRTQLSDNSPKPPESPAPATSQSLFQRDPARWNRLMRLGLQKMEKAGTLTPKGEVLLDTMRRAAN